MKRDIFYRNTLMTHRYGPESESPAHFDPDLPKGLRLNTRGFSASQNGDYDYCSRPDAIQKPNGLSAKRTNRSPEEHFHFLGVPLGRKK